MWIDSIKSRFDVETEGKNPAFEKGVLAGVPKKTPEKHKKDILLSAGHLSFSYDKNKILKDFSIDISGGNIYAIMGGNRVREKQPL